MKVGIIGGGFTGLTAAYELLKKGYQVTVFESQPYWGGLAATVEIFPGVAVERYYHHLFTNDREILGLCAELGVAKKLRYLPGKTSHYYRGKIYPLDSAASVLRFNPLSFLNRLRFGLATAYLKIRPGEGMGFDRVTAARWLRRWYGREAYTIVWEPLLRGKFAAAAEEVAMTWFWARVKKRTSRLIYPEGGFSVLIEALVGRLQEGGVSLVREARIETIRQVENRRWQVTTSAFEGTLGHQAPGQSEYDRILVTTGLKTFSRLFPQLPPEYARRINAIRYLNAQVLILVLKNKLSHHYWINIGEPDFPFLVVCEQSNFFGTAPYRGKSVVYLGNYLDHDDPRLSLSAAALTEQFSFYLKKLNPDFDGSWVEKALVFSGPDAQPIVTRGYKNNIPSFSTPLPGLFLATLAQVYPWDRGTNYAVKLAQDVVARYF